METKNAIIKDVRIDNADGRGLTAYLALDYGDSGQSFGGYVLYLPKGFKYHSINSCAGHFLFRCMDIAGVSSWDKIKGKAIRVKSDHSHVHSIGHIINNDWFCPEEDFKDLHDDIKQ